MRYFIRVLITAILAIAGYCVKSQEFYGSYYPSHNSDTLAAGNYSLHFYNNNFIDNNEYFGPYTEGITYIGSVFQPELTWAMSSKFSLSAGWHLMHYYGREGFEQSLPVIRARYTISPGTQIIFGQLEGRLQHGYIEPIYNEDNYFIKNPEYGIQLLVDRKRLHTDVYMDWEKFLMPGDPFQEVITGGLLASYRLNDNLKNKGFSAHFQSIIHHFGGQVDNVDVPIQTRANLAAGLKYAFLPDSKILERITLSSFYIQALEMSQTNLMPFRSGFSVHNTVTLENSWIKLSTGWFHGEYFFAPMGDYLFQSISQFNTWYVGDKRDLVTSKLLIGHQIMKGVDLGIRYESYYDVQRKTQDFSYGLNISVNAKVFEKKLK